MNKVAKAKKMKLSTAKSEVTMSSDKREAAWTPSITLNGQPMPFNPTPNFFGDLGPSAFFQPTLQRQLAQYWPDVKC